MKVSKTAKRLVSLATAGVAIACTTMFVSAPEASAVTWEHTMRTDDGDPGGLIRFRPDGDYVQVCDIEADGWSVWGDYQDPNGQGSTLTKGGHGTCSKAVNDNYANLAEGKWIRFKVCLQHYKYGPLEYCDTTSWFNG
jgi:hypothetical protein